MFRIQPRSTRASPHKGNILESLNHDSTNETSKSPRFTLYSTKEMFGNIIQSEKCSRRNEEKHTFGRIRSNVRVSCNTNFHRESTKSSCNSGAKKSQKKQSLTSKKVVFQNVKSTTAKCGNSDKRNKPCLMGTLPVKSQHLSKGPDTKCLDVFVLGDETCTRRNSRTLQQQKKVNLQVLLTINKTKNELEILRERRSKLAGTYSEDKNQNKPKEE